MIEAADDSRQDFIQAVGLATYSSSKPTVLSYFSIFENLWKQTELYHQLKESNKQLKLAYEQLKISDKMQSDVLELCHTRTRSNPCCFTYFATGRPQPRPKPIIRTFLIPSLRRRKFSNPISFSLPIYIDHPIRLVYE